MVFVVMGEEEKKLVTAVKPCENPSDYLVDVLGNDPEFDLSDNYASFMEAGYKHFSIVGCSGLRNLSIIRDIFEASRATGTTSPPEVRLVIIDNSEKVKAFWELFIEQISTSKDLDDLVSKMDIFTESGRPYIELCNVSQRRAMEGQGYLQTVIGQDFEAFKTILTEHTTILLNSWSDSAAFTEVADYLSSRPGSINAIYGSNVLEFLNPEEQEMMIQNIERLENCETPHADLISYAYAIHTRTSVQSRTQAVARLPEHVCVDETGIFLPDTVLFAPSWDEAVDQRALLYGDELVKIRDPSEDQLSLVSADSEHSPALTESTEEWPDLHPPSSPSDHSESGDETTNPVQVFKEKLRDLQEKPPPPQPTSPKN